MSNNNMNEEIRIQDGKKYIVKHCFKCNSELLFQIKDEPRRVHGACAKCGHPIEVWIDKE